MFSKLPMYQRQGNVAYKKDLIRTELLLTHLNSPHKHFKSIHIGGTNGKGSTAHMIASVFQESGYKVGLYTSPHLIDFRERILINGCKISKEFIIRFVKQNKDFFESNHLSFFEMTVGMAFKYFSKEKVDVAIIEVGLGGRLDSTNIINPEISIITNIGMDHTEFLGDTLQKIATEKAGIIKRNVPVIIGERQTEVENIFISKANSLNSDIYFADEGIDQTIPCSLGGEYQQKNVKTALQSLKVLQSKGFYFSDNQITEGLIKIQKNTGLRGRWELISKTPKIICDTAHNREGLILVLNQLQKESYETLHIVLGMVSDKSVESIIDLFPKKAIYYFCKPNISRGMDVEILADKFLKFGYIGAQYSSVNAAFNNAKQQCSIQDLIFVGGSTFVVAEVI
jgi:dihydrofolate synthase/folylpolyglutamate synthase